MNLKVIFTSDLIFQPTSNIVSSPPYSNKSFLKGIGDIFSLKDSNCHDDYIIPLVTMRHHKSKSSQIKSRQLYLSNMPDMPNISMKFQSSRTHSATKY